MRENGLVSLSDTSRLGAFLLARWFLDRCAPPPLPAPIRGVDGQQHLARVGARPSTLPFTGTRCDRLQAGPAEPAPPRVPPPAHAILARSATACDVPTCATSMGSMPAPFATSLELSSAKCSAGTDSAGSGGLGSDGGEGCYGAPPSQGFRGALRRGWHLGVSARAADPPARAVARLREPLVFGRSGEADGAVLIRTRSHLEGRPLLIEDFDPRDRRVPRSPAVLGDHRRLDTLMVLSERVEASGALQLQDPRSLNAHLRYAPRRLKHSVLPRLLEVKSPEVVYDVRRVMLAVVRPSRPAWSGRCSPPRRARCSAAHRASG